LEQVGRALKNGVRFSAWTFDELYGRNGQFLDGMDSLGQATACPIILKGKIPNLLKSLCFFST